MSASSGNLKPAPSELSDSEIQTRYGPLISEALDAFQSDPSYLVDMAENAATIAYKRSVWEIRAEAETMTSDPETIKELALQLLSDRGLQAPRKTGARRRRSPDAA